MGPIALHLLVGGHRTENDLGESLTGESPEANSANRPSVLHQRQCFVLRVKDLNSVLWKSVLNVADYHHTSRVMYSFGIRGSWWENTFWRAINQSIVCLGTLSVRLLAMQWKAITPFLSSILAASSRGACSGNIAWKLDNFYFYLFLYWLSAEVKNVANLSQYRFSKLSFISSLYSENNNFV